MSERKYKVGDAVQFPWGPRGERFVQGVIREDRGPLGIGGRHLYGIEFHTGLDDEPPSYIELPAVEFELVEDPVSTN
jgi:hypothetical protein